MNGLKFVVVNFPGNNGGNIVLDNLARNIREAGYHVKTVYIDPAIEYRGELSMVYWIKSLRLNISYDVKMKLVKIFPNAFKHNKKFETVLRHKGFKFGRKRSPLIDDSTVVIYPDVYYGNPLRAKRVVRYLLYYNRFPDDPKAYGKDDLFFCYRQQFNDETLNPKKRELKLSYFDLDLYKRTNYGKRSGNCYIIRKGANRDDLPNSFDGIIIDDLLEEEKVKVFNDCEYCISYDTATAYSGIAAMCGCISVIVPEKGEGRSSYLSNGEEGYGCAYGFSHEEIEFAKATSDKIIGIYQKRNAEGLVSTREFAKVCEDYFREQ